MDPHQAEHRLQAFGTARFPAGFPAHAAAPARAGGATDGTAHAERPLPDPGRGTPPIELPDPGRNPEGPPGTPLPDPGREPVAPLPDPGREPVTPLPDPGRETTTPTADAYVGDHPIGEGTGDTLQLSAHNVLAVFPSLEAVRPALETLQQHGIDAADVSVIGRNVPEASSPSQDMQRENAAVGTMGRKVVIGIATGVAIGAAAGAVLGLLFALVLSESVAALALAGAVVGTLFGAMAGALVNAERRLNMSPAWELTFAEVGEGRAVVGVHTGDPALADRAAQLLGPLTDEPVRRYDGDGRLVDAATGA